MAVGVFHNKGEEIHLNILRAVMSPVHKVHLLIFLCKLLLSLRLNSQKEDILRKTTAWWTGHPH